MKKVYLKPNVVIEPLFCKWYAWPHLISPATSAMNVANRHLKIINSYIQAPQIHAAAVKNPKMKGGPFMDLGGVRVEEVKKLRDETLKSQCQMIELSKSITELDKMLKSHAKGYSLETLYEKVPDNLKGYVELVYDLNNNPSFRLFESLLYYSKFYDVEMQTIAMWVTNNDERPFALSTPRLEEPHVLHLKIPFSHPAIDLLSRMKREPMDIEIVKKQLMIDPSKMNLFESFFTDEVPEHYAKYSGDKIRMRYFGHACILIETNDVSILIDPLISYYGYQSSIDHYSDIDLPDEIDFILITHNHQDHILFETLLPLRHKTKNIIVPKGGTGSLQDPGLKLMLKQIGFKNVIELSELDEVDINGVKIMGIPFIGEHSDLNIMSKICHLVNVDGFKMMFVADSCNIEPRLYNHVKEIIGSVDVIFLGMECDGAPLSWLYGPLLTEDLPRDKDNSRRLAGSNFERGVGIVETFQPKETYVYAMGQEPWLEFISSIKYTEDSNPIVASNKLIEHCIKRGIIAERLYGEKELLYVKGKEQINLQKNDSTVLL